MTKATLWRDAAPLVLASGSSARQAMLQSAGIPFEAVAAEIDERAVEAPLRARAAAPEAIATHLAAAKAAAVSRAYPNRLVLGADQVLALGSEIFTKPVSIDMARHQLERLAGHTHELHSALCLMRDGRLECEEVATARLAMRPLSPAFLDVYLAAEGDAVRASVGAYRLEGLGVQLFSRIEGDHTTILGLPLLQLLPALRRIGVLLG